MAYYCRTSVLPSTSRILQLSVIALCLLAGLGQAKPFSTSPQPSQVTTEPTAATSGLSPQEELCKLTVRTYIKVGQDKGYVCYVRNTYEQAYQVNDLVVPANSMPCIMESASWQKKLGHTVGVVDNIHHAAYVQLAVEFEKILNACGSNVFHARLANVANRTGDLNSLLQRVVSATEGVNMEDLRGKADVCEPANDGDDQPWPVTREAAGDEATYLHYLKLYNFGVLESLCDTIGWLHAAMQYAMDDSCV